MSGQKTAQKDGYGAGGGGKKNWILMWAARCGRGQGRAGVGLKRKRILQLLVLLGEVSQINKYSTQ